MKNEVLKLSRDLSSLLADAAAIPGVDHQRFDAWGDICARIREQAASEVLRVAVVGSIKSGKSTFANALFGDDLLKRGAGVVTSIVTRVRKGERRVATLFFKSWDEINAEIRQALLFFPAESGFKAHDAFDMRRAEDRLRVERALGEMASDLLVNGDSLNANAVLLSAYLKGYEAVEKQVSSDSQRLVFEDSDFHRHADFVGDDTRAVYLKDVQIKVDAPVLTEDVEIADCQGSDSPNPHHLAMIQDYLAVTHLIVYVISSRMGLRQADVKFLSMIRKMGIIDSILFVVNTDFSEHESLDDLQRLIRRVESELSVLKPDAPLYAFSALYNLFDAQAETLAEKERLRMAQWEADTAMTGFARQETERFASAFSRVLTRERSALLMKNHLERMGVIVDGMNRWVRLSQDILSGDLQGGMAIIDKLKGHRLQIDQVKSMISSTLAGAVLKEKQTLKKEVDQLFSRSGGKLIGNALAFIRSYDPPVDQIQTHMDSNRFSHVLFMVFQDFRRAVDAHVAENVNPEIIRFVRQKERQVFETLRSAVDPYHAMVEDILNGYEDIIGQDGDPSAAADARNVSVPDLDGLKNLAGLAVPPMSATLRYSARIRTDAAVRLSLYTLVRIARKLFKKNDVTGENERLRALRDGVKRIKYETEKAADFHFKNYRENLKFQYLFKLTDMISGSVFDAVNERFHTYDLDLTHFIAMLDRRGGEREAALTGLEKIDARIERIEKDIRRCRPCGVHVN